jgi:hypothetical protein
VPRCTHASCARSGRLAAASYATVRSFAALALLAGLAVSVAACGGGGDDSGVRSQPASTVAANATTSPSERDRPGESTSEPVLVVTAPSTTSATPPPTGESADTSESLAGDLAAIDADLAGIDAALHDYDQITATTEGDPSR